MKAAREHGVPLSTDALAILNDMAATRLNDDIFPGNKKGLSDGAMLAVLKRMCRSDVTVHGFRSTFRDWAAESTAYPGEVVEMALAHAINNLTEAAYRRGDLLEKRRRLMEEWARYCKASKLSGEVVPINKTVKVAVQFKSNSEYLSCKLYRSVTKPPTILMTWRNKNMLPVLS
jgi:hypothetical protein